MLIIVVVFAAVPKKRFLLTVHSGLEGSNWPFLRIFGYKRLRLCQQGFRNKNKALEIKRKAKDIAKKASTIANKVLKFAKNLLHFAN